MDRKVPKLLINKQNKMTELLGLVMIYSWIHGAIIAGKKIQGATQYENVVLIFGLIFFAVFVLDSI